MSDVTQWRRLDRWPVTKRMLHRDDCCRATLGRRRCSCKPARLAATRRYEIEHIVTVYVLPPLLGVGLGELLLWAIR